MSAVHVSLICLPLCLRLYVLALICVRLRPRVHAGSPVPYAVATQLHAKKKKMKKLRSLCNAGGTDHGVAPQLSWLGRERREGGREGRREGGREGGTDHGVV